METSARYPRRKRDNGADQEKPSYQDEGLGLSSDDHVVTALEGHGRHVNSYVTPLGLVETRLLVDNQVQERFSMW